MPVMAVFWHMERNGVLIDAQLLATQSRELGEQMLELEAQAHDDRRPAVQPELAASRSGDPVRAAAAAGRQEDAQRRAVHRRGRARRARAGLPAAEAAARVPRPVEAQVHLHRQAAADGQPDDRPRAHELCAGGRGDRAAVEQRSQPAEHPDPHRRGPAHPRGVHRAAGRTYRLAPTTRRSSCASWRTSRGDAGLLRAFAAGQDMHRATAAEVFGVAARAR